MGINIKEKVRSYLLLVMANPGWVLKKRVLGFDFKKYPGRVLGFQKCTKLAIFGGKKCQISLKITKLMSFVKI